MKKIKLTLITLATLSTMQLTASTINEDPTAKQLSNGITIINQKSPDFLLGKETHINMKFVPEDAQDM